MADFSVTVKFMMHFKPEEVMLRVNSWKIRPIQQKKKKPTQKLQYCSSLNVLVPASNTSCCIQPYNEWRNEYVVVFSSIMTNVFCLNHSHLPTFNKGYLLSVCFASSALYSNLFFACIDCKNIWLPKVEMATQSAQLLDSKQQSAKQYIRQTISLECN